MRLSTSVAQVPIQGGAATEHLGGPVSQEQIDQLATQVQTTSTAVKSAAAKLPANASLAQIVQALSKLAPQFRTLQSTAQATTKTIESAGGSLADAFKSEKSCKKLG